MVSHEPQPSNHFLERTGGSASAKEEARSEHAFPFLRNDDAADSSGSEGLRTTQQKPATPTQALSTVGLPLRWMVASISPYGRSAA